MMKMYTILILLVFVSQALSQACDSNPCGVGECKEVLTRANKYRCVCPLGYLESSNGTCEDVDECTFKGNKACGKGSICFNTPGSFNCDCKKSHYWDGFECQRKDSFKVDKLSPDFLIKPQERVMTEIGSELSLTCVAWGKPLPRIYWTKGVKRVRMGPTAQGGHSLFYLPAVTAKDVDVYECVIEDAINGRILRAKVDISVPSMPCQDPGLKMFGAVWQYKNWDNALTFCQNQGLTLAVISTVEERKAMRTDAWRAFNRDPNGKKFANQYWLWIGVTDSEVEGEFKTVWGDEVAEGVAKWMPGTPDNWQGLTPDGQDVMAIHRLSGDWDDTYPFHLRPFACQCDPSKLAELQEE